MYWIIPHNIRRLDDSPEYKHKVQSVGRVSVEPERRNVTSSTADFQPYHNPSKAPPPTTKKPTIKTLAPGAPADNIFGVSAADRALDGVLDGIMNDLSISNYDPDKSAKVAKWTHAALSRSYICIFIM